MRTLRPQQVASVWRRGTNVILAAVMAAAVVTFPMSANASANAPAGSDAQALAVLNGLYREPMGLPDVDWLPSLASAAQNHANYWALGGAFGHEETPGAPGFTGVEPWDRCHAVGAPPCGEVAFQLTDLVAAMQGWLDTPYHGEALISADQVGCGTSTRGSDCDMTNNLTVDASNSSAPANGPNSPVRIWPYSGAMNVPLAWFGGEIPDPLANYTGDHTNVGPTLFFYVSSADAQVTLLDPSGQPIPLIAPGRATAVSPLVLAYAGWADALPADRFQPLSTYILTVRTTDGAVRTVAFTTMQLPNPVSVNTVVSGQTVWITVLSAAPNPTLSITGPQTLTPALDLDDSATLSLPAGDWQACASSGGSGTGYAPDSGCATFTIAPAPGVGSGGVTTTTPSPRDLPVATVRWHVRQFKRRVTVTISAIPRATVVTVTAARRRHRMLLRAMRPRKRNDGIQFVGFLPPGRWTLTITCKAPSGYRAPKPTRIAIRVR